MCIRRNKDLFICIYFLLCNKKHQLCRSIPSVYFLVKEEKQTEAAFK